MSSHRATRSSFGNGRSSNGDDISWSSRPSSCSYLSNVRPENRSTLCSMMAQLTEETQASFETTLKSKAVSEKCNVKFSCVVTGHPAPQVIWYKDDVQLDRYCGLPKYEIFHSGQNHSLHIYNCTLEDAAIYQVSASNSKGIVSCSGVLEVGEMNEFKIHQHYFAKLKQRADNRRSEVEGKENQEPLRTISPDRTQRKRRSTMEAFLSTPSSMEDEGNEESRRVLAVETDARLQEATVKEAEEEQVPITNGAVSSVINGQAISENGKTGTSIHDSALKISTTHQPKTPFVKKKIKISNSVKFTKSETPGERTSEERRAKDETLSCVALACTESVQSDRNLEELMEVENIVSSSSVVDSDPRPVTEHQKSGTEDLLFVEKLSKDDNIHVEASVLLDNEHLTATSPAAALTCQTGSVTEGKQTAEHKKEAGHESTEDHLERQNQIPHISQTEVHISAAVASPGMANWDISETEDATVTDIEEKSNTSTGAPLAHRVSVKASCESRTALLQPACEQAGDQLSEKETSPRQKNVFASQPALLSEVTLAHRKKNRNDAPASFEPPLNHFTISAQPPQKVPSKRDTSTDAIQTPSFNRGLQSAIYKMTQDTQGHSRGSNESHTVLFTDLPKSPLQSHGGGEKNRGCKVSSSAQHTQVDTTIKTVKETEIQVRKKVEGKVVGKLKQSDRGSSIEQAEMETETAAHHMVKTENTKNTAEKEVIVGGSNKPSEKKKHTLKIAEEGSSELHNITFNLSDPAVPPLRKTPQNTALSKLQLKEQEIQKPVAKVISIAELLRSQLKALDSTSAKSATAKPAHVGFVQDPTATSIEACEDLKEDDGKWKQEVKNSVSDSETGTSVEDTPPRNVKELLMGVYHQLKTDQEQIQTQCATSPTVHASENSLLLPPTSVIDTGTTIESSRLHGRAKKYNKTIIGGPKKTGASTLVSNLSGSVSQEPGTPLTVTPSNVSTQESRMTVLKHTEDEPPTDKNMGLIKTIAPEIKRNSKTQSGISETLLDQYKMDEHKTKNSLQNLQKFPNKNEFVTENNLIQQDSLMIVQFSRTDSPASPTSPQASPLLKNRNCVSSVPSATAQELASGARRKILVQVAKTLQPSEAVSLGNNQTLEKGVPTESNKLTTSPVALSPSPNLSQRSPLLLPPGEQTPPAERRSPLFSRRKWSPETEKQSPKPTEGIHTPKTEEKLANKDKHDPFKAPQVIRKIRGETFADASGHLKLWCQFFNVLSDSTIKWYRNEEEIAEIKRNAGDETQANLAIVQASCKDSGVYGCTITNEYGTESTDCLLSADILSGMPLREDLGVGEEIEMTPMIFSKGVADSGVWGNKFFGRIIMQDSHIGDGCSHKVWRAKVIYGLEPVFESGNTCIIKACNPIAYGGKGDSCLIERNLETVTQECKIQNLAREYCKIFSAEARAIENFGPSLEVIPVYLMYRPANAVPYATVEADLTGVYERYSRLDHTGRIDVKSGSDVEQKCCALQHWIFQWTSGNILLTRLEGADNKITNVGISVKSTGPKGLSVEGTPKVFEHFVSQHRCNYFCGLLSLRSLKVMDSLLSTTKPKGSKSPLLQRKMADGSSSPQTGRKAAGSPRLPRKSEQEDKKTPYKHKAADALKVVKME